MSYTIDIDLTLPKIKASNRNHLLDILAEEITRHVPYSKEDMYDLLLQGEHTNGSGIGEGVAIPQMKLKNLPKRFVAIASLKEPVDFDSVDHQPVDLVCVFLSPEKDGNIHLRGLSRISRILRNREIQQKLREVSDPEAMRFIASDPGGWLMAA